MRHIERCASLDANRHGNDNRKDEPMDDAIFPTIEWCERRGYYDFNEWLTIAGSVPIELADGLSDNDKDVARQSIDNYGVVIIDGYDNPISDFDYVELLMSDHHMGEFVDDIRSGLIVNARVKL